MTQIDLSAARYIAVNPVLAMSEFIKFGPEGQSDCRHSMGVHGVAVMHRVLPLRISSGRQALLCLKLVELSRSSLLTSHAKFRFHTTASRLARFFFLCY